MPSDHDGMATFPGPKRGTTFLVRNHELSVNEAMGNEPVEGSNPLRRHPDRRPTGIIVDNDTRKALRD